MQPGGWGTHFNSLPVILWLEVLVSKSWLVPRCTSSSLINLSASWCATLSSPLCKGWEAIVCSSLISFVQKPLLLVSTVLLFNKKGVLCFRFPFDTPVLALAVEGLSSASAAAPQKWETMQKSWWMMAAFWEDAAAWSFTYLNTFPLYIYMSYFIYISPSTTDPPFRGGALMKLLFKEEENTWAYAREIL